MLSRTFDEIFRQSIYALDRVDGPDYPIKSKIFGGIAFEIFDMYRSNPVGNVSIFLDFLAFAFPLAKNSHGQIAQDLWAIYMLQGLREGVFVEIGAGDGLYLSNTLLLERDFGWAGLLCEPNPNHKRALASRKAIFCPEAVSDRAGEVQFNLMTDSYLSRIDAEVERDIHDQLGNRKIKKKYSVPTTTFDTLCEKHGVTHVDFLSVDTEGTELPILKTIDFSAWKIPVVCVEHNWTSAAPEMMKLMAEFGYETWIPEFTQSDYFFFNRSFIELATQRPRAER